MFTLRQLAGTLRPMKKWEIKALAEIYIQFFRIGLFTFGGGIAMMPLMKRDLIEKRNWITEDELVDYYAIGQSTPGIIAVNVSTFVGYKRAGIIGGILGTLGIATPSVIIIMALAGLIDSVDRNIYMQKALRGINVAVAALLTDVTLNFAKKTAATAASFCIMAVSFALVYFLKIPSYYVILSAASIGICLHFIRKRRNANQIRNAAENAAGAAQTDGALNENA